MFSKPGLIHPNNAPKLPSIAMDATLYFQLRSIIPVSEENEPKKLATGPLVVLLPVVRQVHTRLWTCRTMKREASPSYRLIPMSESLPLVLLDVSPLPRGSQQRFVTRLCGGEREIPLPK